MIYAFPQVGMYGDPNTAAVTVTFNGASQASPSVVWDEESNVLVITFSTPATPGQFIRVWVDPYELGIRSKVGAYLAPTFYSYSA